MSRYSRGSPRHPLYTRARITRNPGILPSRHISFPFCLKPVRFVYFFLSTFCWCVSNGAVYKPCTNSSHEVFIFFFRFTPHFLFSLLLSLFSYWSFLWRNFVPCPSREITACLWAKTHGAEGAKRGNSTRLRWQVNHSGWAFIRSDLAFLISWIVFLLLFCIVFDSFLPLAPARTAVYAV